MRCPYCFSSDTKVLDSRESENSVRRRRECIPCKKRFTTYERVENVELFVVKKGKEREHFDRHKLMRGILKACEKRPVRTQKIELTVDDIENSLRGMEKIEIPSKIIGELVMHRLKDLDQVAYVRFASVYREFKDVKQFIPEIKKAIEK